jgi:type VI protein secretion system component VasK
VYAAEYTKQWQEAMRAVAVQKTHGAPTSESFEEKREEAD